jgi:hypothetical protein
MDTDSPSASEQTPAIGGRRVPYAAGFFLARLRRGL